MDAELRLARPATLAEAVTLLAAEPGAKAVAGGTDLVPNLKRGIGAPPLLVDLTAVRGNGAIEVRDGAWRIGAGVTLAALERHADLARALPALAQAAAAVAGPAHRSAATVGGNLCQDTRCIYYNQSAWWREANRGCLKLNGDTCHVAPQGQRCHAAYEGDLAAAALAHGAEVEVVGPGGTRRMALATLYRDDGAAHLTLAAGELIAALHVPAPAPGSVSAFRKLRARGAMDFPLAAVAATLRLDGGVVAALVVGVSGTNSHPLLLTGTQALIGQRIDEAWLSALGKLVQQQVQPMRSTVTAAHHRRLVASVAAQRLLRDLGARGTGPSSPAAGGQP